MLDSLFNKVSGLKACNFIKKRLQRKCFSVNIAKFLRTAFLQNTSGGCFWNMLLLNWLESIPTGLDMLELLTNEERGLFNPPSFIHLLSMSNIKEIWHNSKFTREVWKYVQSKWITLLLLQKSAEFSKNQQYLIYRYISSIIVIIISNYFQKSWRYFILHKSLNVSTTTVPWARTIFYLFWKRTF